MKKLEVGSKLYHFYYGPMTVVAFDNKYVDVSFDEPRREWPISGTPIRGGMGTTFPSSAYGYWYFDNISKIGTENSNASMEQGQLPKALIINKDVLHPYFDADKVAYKEGVVSSIEPVNAKSVDTASAIEPVNDIDNEPSAIEPIK